MYKSKNVFMHNANIHTHFMIYGNIFAHKRTQKKNFSVRRRKP